MLSGAGIVTYAMADQGARSDGKAGGREPAVHTLKLQSEGAGRRGLAKRGTERFSAVLLTWDDADAKAKGRPRCAPGTWRPASGPAGRS